MAFDAILPVILATQANQWLIKPFRFLRILFIDLPLCGALPSPQTRPFTGIKERGKNSIMQIEPHLFKQRPAARTPRLILVLLHNVNKRCNCSYEELPRGITMSMTLLLGSRMYCKQHFCQSCIIDLLCGRYSGPFSIIVIIIINVMPRA